MPLRISKSWAAGLKPDETLDYASWADKYFYLPKESTSEYGRFRCERTPFIREILEELSPESPAEVVVVVKPTQQAGTTAALIFICGMIDMHPGPCLMVMPTDSMCKSFSKKKLTPAISITPKLKGKLAPPKSRSSENTIKQKEFLGGSLMLTGSYAGTAYRTESIKYLIVDDFNGCPEEILKEGDIRTLADRRTGTFPDRKIYLNSTTTHKKSNIEMAFKESSQGYYHVPCPHCGFYQYPRWGGKDAEYGIKFIRNPEGEIIDIWYECEGCHKRIDENQKTKMLEGAKYIHKFPERSKIRGFRYNAFVAPVGWVNSWRYIAEEHLKAVKDLRAGNPAKYIAWLNTLAAEPYEESGDRPSWVSLKARCEPYQPMSVPDKVRFITTGVDVQGNRLAVSVYGWSGADEECWLIYHIEIPGDPMHDDVWQQLDQILSKNWEKSSGGYIKICSAGIDSGDGNTTQAVRNYCRFRSPIVFALKGSNQTNRPVLGLPTKQDIAWNGEKISGGVEVWPVGTDTSMATLYSKLKIITPGPNYIHFYLGISDEYFEQMTANKLITRFVKGYPKREWHNVRGNKRDEAGDCWRYAYAAAIRAGMPYMNREKDQQQIKKTPKRQEKTNNNNSWFSGSFNSRKGF